MEMSNAVLPCFSSCTAPSRLSSNVGSSIEFTMLPGLGQRAKSADFQRSTSKTVYHSVPPAGKTKQKHHEPEQPSNLNDHIRFALRDSERPQHDNIHTRPLPLFPQQPPSGCHRPVLTGGWTVPSAGIGLVHSTAARTACPTATAPTSLYACCY